MKKLMMSLVAAALTAVAFAAISVAQDDGGLPELSAEDREALEGFRTCMEENGAPAPPAPPEPGGDGTFERHLKPPSEEERAKIEEAFKACEDQLPEGARAFGPGPGGPPCGPPPGGPPPGDRPERTD